MKVTHPKKRAFLAAYSECANVTRAAQIAGVSRDQHYDWKAKDAAYAEAFALAGARAGDALEDECFRRAQLGVVEAVYHAGKEVGKRRRFSDVLAWNLLRGLKPAKYNTERHELSGPDQGPIRHALDLSALTEEELAALERIAGKVLAAQP
jgi:hypothetical protein